MSSMVNSTSPTGLVLQQDPTPYLEELLILIRVLCPLWIATISFGLMANIINIVVFLKAGVKDSVTVLLISLAMSDLVFLALITPNVSGVIIFFFVPSIRSRTSVYTNILYWPAFTAYDLSAFISVSLGVMRCACVAMPLKFKFVFTKSRTVKWVMFLVVLAFALRTPVLTMMRLAWKIDPAINIPVAYLKTVNRKSMSRINDIMNRGFIIYFNYITMVTCLVILTTKLYQASKIRRSCKARPSTDQISNTTDEKGLSLKDLQVVKSVVLVCTIFILSQLTFLVYSSNRLINPDFDYKGPLVYLFGMLSQISMTCSYLNASLNIFVYFNFNSKFKTVFKSLFSPQGEK